MERKQVQYMDGSYIFQNEKDKQLSLAAAEAVSRHFGCEIRAFPELCQIDWYGQKYGRMTGLLEYKGRTCEEGTYPTVYLSFAKWVALVMAQLGSRVPGIFVAGFTDSMRWTRAWDIKVSGESLKIGGAAGERAEPVIEVPISGMKMIRK